MRLLAEMLFRKLVGPSPALAKQKALSWYASKLCFKTTIVPPLIGTWHVLAVEKSSRTMENIKQWEYEQFYSIRSNI